MTPVNPVPSKKFDDRNVGLIGVTSLIILPM